MGKALLVEDSDFHLLAFPQDLILSKNKYWMVALHQKFECHRGKWADSTGSMADCWDNVETNATSVLYFYMIWFKQGWTKKPGNIHSLCRKQPLNIHDLYNVFFQEWMQTGSSHRPHYDRILILSCYKMVDSRTLDKNLIW